MASKIFTFRIGDQSHSFSVDEILISYAVAFHKGDYEKFRKTIINDVKSLKTDGHQGSLSENAKRIILMWIVKPSLQKTSIERQIDIEEMIRDSKR